MPCPDVPVCLRCPPLPCMFQAITWAWELSTKVFGLPVERVWVSAAAAAAAGARRMTLVQ
jgi:hypothetical protein